MSFGPAGPDSGGQGPSGGWLHEKGANDTGDILWTIQEKKTENVIDKHRKISEKNQLDNFRKAQSLVEDDAPRALGSALALPPKQTGKPDKQKKLLASLVGIRKKAPGSEPTGGDAKKAKVDEAPKVDTAKVAVAASSPVKGKEAEKPAEGLSFGDYSDSDEE
ncbi:hypothetical protein T484DRAFT_1907039 [Baffinella frigidus]|nr:hypothetical protein T484DRAFT_1907039 [Cryptophyta sp. CCMP2293]|mmetsp:Transcript_65592/g.156499  ORF Transcript_65592/g.156499 Transcript_65592/m.156499 type:complete len:163 (-) Transcript_65592:47-535(-)